MSTYTYREHLVGDVLAGDLAEDLAVQGARERARVEHLVPEGEPTVTRSTDSPGPDEPWHIDVAFEVHPNAEERPTAAYDLALEELLDRRPGPAYVCGSPMRRHVFGPLAAEELREGVRHETRCSECHRLITRAALLELGIAEAAGEPWWAAERPFDVLIFQTATREAFDDVPGAIAQKAVGDVVRQELTDGRAVVQGSITLAAGVPFESWDTDPETGEQLGVCIAVYRVTGRSTWIATAS